MRCSVSLVAAVFSLAEKLQPAIVFIDEVDSFLGQRRSTGNEAMAIMKTEFMALWDGVATDSESTVSCLTVVELVQSLKYVCLCCRECEGDGSWCDKQTFRAG